MKRLNFGCQTDIKSKSDGWINLDIYPYDGIDVQHDMNKYPYPFPDSTFDEVYSRLSLYVVDDWIKCITELHRISKKGARWLIVVPWYNHRSAYNTLCKHQFTQYSFDYFDFNRKKSSNPKYHGITPILFKITKKTVIPTKFGKFFPAKLFMGQVLGNIIKSIQFEMEVTKGE